MAVSVTYSPDYVATKRLFDAIDSAINKTDRTVSQAVSWAAQNIAASGRSAAKIGKKKYDVVRNPEYAGALKSFAWARKQRKYGKQIPIEAQRELDRAKMITPFYIKQLRQNNFPRMIPSYDKRDPRRNIPETHTVKTGGYGLAKKVFNVLQAKSAESMDKKNFYRRGKDYGLFKNAESTVFGTDHKLKLKLKLTYLTAAYPNIVTTATTKAAKSMEQKIQMDVAKFLREFNK